MLKLNEPQTAKSRDIVPDIKQEVLKRRCLLKDPDGNIIETPEQMYMRVAQTVTKVESQYETQKQVIQLLPEIFYKMMAEGKFLPNSPTLMNAGRPDGMLSACFVLPVNDSIPEIFEAVKNTALIQKAGGGTGFAFDKLRPTGDTVSSSGGNTSGPISFWRVIAETTNAIQQGAHRRGANMGMMSVEHPDIIRFINAKCDIAAFNNFNISVKIPDRFMDLLGKKPDAPHIVTNLRTQQQYVIPKTIDLHSYNIQDLRPVGGDKNNCYTIGDVWKMIISNAHATGEPGVCFIDRVNEDNPTPDLGRINATNPCGEQPLLDYEACNLGSLNISKFVLPDGSDLDWQNLGIAISYAVRFLDDVIDANHWPIPEIREVSLGNRKIGLGIMGFADALVLLGIRYDSDEAVSFARMVGLFVKEQAHGESKRLAQQRGCFPNWEGSIWDTDHHIPMRNAGCTTIAPTGSISIIAKCSGGIEPIYSLGYKRRALDGDEFVQLHPLLEELGMEQGWMNEKVKIMLMAGTDIRDIPGIPKELTEVLVTAHQIAPEWHVRIQAAFQSNIDNAVSKTVNLPASATTGDVGKIFQLAYDLNCKGVTVYRDSSRQNQVLSAVLPPVEPNEVSLGPRPRVRVTTGNTSKFRMGCGTLFVTVNKDDKGISEVFSNLGKAGGCPSQSEATCRVVSTALRSGVDPKVIIDQLGGIRCLSTAVARKTNKGVDVLSCPDAIAQALEEALGLSDTSQNNSFIKRCPDCGQILRFESGCDVCDCGYSKCG
ncbi:MAG: adenosylcobalamin-dependent ribonucleoside-diphosphate reductase [Planctomycetes bacterium]|nr:adenosylcobalamin-dependent ribonucleoside-diphosphate reductase [Planctomycetota bacterium]